MSFGFSISDFVTLTQLASQVVRNARQACGAHNELSCELNSLHTVLQRLQHEAEIPESILNQQEDNRREELASLVDGCKKILNTLLQILEKYNALSEEKKSVTKLWQRVKFGNGEMKDLGTIRGELLTHTNAITLYLNLLSLGSQGKIERHMNTHGKDLRKLQHSVNWLIASKQGTAVEGSILTSYKDDDKRFWRELRRDLVHDGYSSSVLERHKKVIKEYVAELANRGVLDDPETIEILEPVQGLEGTVDAKSTSGSKTASAASNNGVQKLDQESDIPMVNQNKQGLDFGLKDGQSTGTKVVKLNADLNGAPIPNGSSELPHTEPQVTNKVNLRHLASTSSNNRQIPTTATNPHNYDTAPSIQQQQLCSPPAFRFTPGTPSEIRIPPPPPPAGMFINSLFSPFFSTNFPSTQCVWTPSTSATTAYESASLDDLPKMDVILSKLWGSSGQPAEVPNSTTSQVPISEDDILWLCAQIKPILLSQPTLLELPAPVTVCADVSGSLPTLLEIFRVGGLPSDAPESRYLFLGNYIAPNYPGHDTGGDRRSMETVCLLLAYKIKYPNSFFLLRGMREARYVGIMSATVFYHECKNRYSLRVWKTLSDIFDCMPFAAVIGQKIFAVHGGISPALRSINQIRSAARPTSIAHRSMLHDLLCSLSSPRPDGWTSTQQYSYFPRFGTDIVDTFLRQHRLDLIVRGNRMHMLGCSEGYEFSPTWQVVTLSASTTPDNLGGLMRVEEDLTCVFKSLKFQAIGQTA